MTVNIPELISFYDFFREERKSQISAITGMIGEELMAGILKDYFESNGNTRCEVMGMHPVQVRKNSNFASFFASKKENRCSL